MLREQAPMAWNPVRGRIAASGRPDENPGLESVVGRQVAGVIARCPQAQAQLQPGSIPGPLVPPLICSTLTVLPARRSHQRESPA